MSVVEESGTVDAPGGDAPHDDALHLPPLGPGDDTPEGAGPPPTDERPIRRAIELAVTAACAAFVFWQLHPELLLADTTPAGGDMGAHVWAMGYLRDVLLPSGRLTGWTPDWYAGFPVFQFYMVVPFLGMVLLNAGVAGAGSFVPLLGSLALSARAAGVRAGRKIGGGLAAVAAVVVLVALFTGFGPGLRFVLVAAAVAAAVVAGRIGHDRWRWWIAAGAIALALGGVSFSYGAAFKLVTVAGVVAMPVSAYLFGRLARLPFPTPSLLAVATVGFLFDKNFTIYGGNIASTMAGEFAFSISLALAIAYLGVLVAGLRTGRHRAGAAVLLALVGLCHLIPAFFALGATAVLLAVHLVAEAPAGSRAGRRTVWSLGALAAAAVVAATVLAAGRTIAGWIPDVPPFGRLASSLQDADGWMSTGPAVVLAVAAVVVVALLLGTRVGASPEDADAADRPPLARGRLWWLLSVGAVAALLAAWWVLPFFWQRTYLNDMGWEKMAVHTEGRSIWEWFTTEVWSVDDDQVYGGLVPPDLLVFAVLALVGAVLSVAFRIRIGVALVVVGISLALAFVYVPQGRLWNARLLPFWYLVVYFLAAIGVGEVVRSLAAVVSTRPGPSRPVARLAAPVALLALTVHLGGQLHNLPLGRAVPAEGDTPASYELFEFLPDPVSPRVTGRNFVTDWARWNYSGYERKNAYPEYRDIVATMADLGRQRGCGMSLWEYSPDLNDYGTPMALMLLPHWTDGCIGSMEGLYFEASSTTPFHFLVQSELSASPSRAQRDMPYRDLDVDAGVEHLQLLGVRYYLARSAEATAPAAEHPDLTEVATSGPWVVYEVARAPVVEPLAALPAVTRAAETQGEWLGCKEGEPPCPGVALEWFQDPSRWDVALAARGPDEWQRVDPGEVPAVQSVTPAVVDDVAVGRDRISFRVDRPGTPVLVKQSYFPNWEADGADGPYRVAPNLMVVVPTDTEVVLRYGRTGVDVVAALASLVGVGLLVVLARARPVRVPALRDPDAED